MIYVGSLNAQETYENARISSTDLNGTARYVGMGGAMDLLVGAKKVILAMEHTAKGNPKILKKCTLPLTAKGQVNMIITEMGVMEVTDKGLVLTEINEEFTVEEVQNATEAQLIISENLKPMEVAALSV